MRWYIICLVYFIQKHRSFIIHELDWVFFLSFLSWIKIISCGFFFFTHLHVYQCMKKLFAYLKENSYSWYTVYDLKDFWICFIMCDNFYLESMNHYSKTIETLISSFFSLIYIYPCNVVLRIHILKKINFELM